jgi:hypothetical protein
MRMRSSVGAGLLAKTALQSPQCNCPSPQFVFTQVSLGKVVQ